MGEIIYWKEFDEPKIVQQEFPPEKITLYGRYICTDETVKSIRIFGWADTQRETPTFFLKIELMLIGSTWQRGLYSSQKSYIDLSNELISQAEQYLQSLK